MHFIAPFCLALASSVAVAQGVPVPNAGAPGAVDSVKRTGGGGYGSPGWPEESALDKREEEAGDKGWKRQNGEDRDRGWKRGENQEDWTPGWKRGENQEDWTPGWKRGENQEDWNQGWKARAVSDQSQESALRKRAENSEDAQRGWRKD